MTAHLGQFAPRDVVPLSLVARDGWQMKRYAIVAAGRGLTDDVVHAATAEGFRRLPPPGSLEDSTGNHGAGFQIIHFAETAVVSPIFYWQWGSVLARADQIRAPWDAPTSFGDGAADVVGCIWEMNIVSHEVEAWTTTMLSGEGAPTTARLSHYLGQCA